MSEHEELSKVNGGWLTPDREIRVQQDDIDHARQRDQWGCAIVRAIQRTFPDAIRVRVNAKLTGYSIGETRYTFPTPPEAVEAIIKPFDQGKPVEPTTIKLRAGKMKDVQHADNRVLQQKRSVKRNEVYKERSDREKQMSTNYREYERF
ncbi:MAG TPA: hypothetical protein VGR89_00455 [Puia sp.]|nr:hypothetical protein [Puia sp.]